VSEAASTIVALRNQEAVLALPIFDEEVAYTLGTTLHAKCLSAGGRFGPMFAAEIRKNRVAHLRRFPQWRCHLDEVFVKINGKLCYLWRAVDHEGEVLETVVTAKRDKAAALKFLKRIMKKYGQPRSVVTDGLCSYPAAMKEIGNADRHEVGRRLNNRAENSHQPFRRRERAM
jgi:putative transposase